MRGDAVAYPRFVRRQERHRAVRLRRAARRSPSWRDDKEATPLASSHALTKDHLRRHHAARRADRRRPRRASRARSRSASRRRTARASARRRPSSMAASISAATTATSTSWGRTATASRRRDEKLDHPRAARQARAGHRQGVRLALDLRQRRQHVVRRRPGPQAAAAAALGHARLRPFPDAVRRDRRAT